MTAKFELFKDKAGEYRWRLRHQNGNVIADSGEGYSTKISAINGIESVKKNISIANIKEINVPINPSESLKPTALGNEPAVANKVRTVARAPVSEPVAHLSPEIPPARAADQPLTMADETLTKAQNDQTSSNMKPSTMGNSLPDANNVPVEVLRARVLEPALPVTQGTQPAKNTDRPSQVTNARPSETVAPKASQNKPKVVGQPVSSAKRSPENELVIIVAIIVAAAFLVLAAGILLLPR